MTSLKYIKLLAVSLLMATLQVNCMKKNLPKKVLIFHGTHKDNITKIFKEGLKSSSQLESEGKGVDGMLFQMDSFETSRWFSGLFFKYIDPRELEKVKDGVWKYKNSNSDFLFVAIKVDPNKTFVLNKMLGRRRRCDLYHNSKILLSLYLEQLNEKEGLRNHRDPRKFIISNPLTAKPIIVDRRCQYKYYPDWKYLNEIVFKHIIYPESLEL